MISAVEDAVNPGSALFFGHISTSESPMPWDITMWGQRYGAEGTPVLENASTEQVITNTIDLFEYASLSSEVVKQEFLSDIDNRVSALESALGTVESSLDKIITGE